MLHGCPPSPDAWGRLNVVTPLHNLSKDSHINSSLREGPLRHLVVHRWTNTVASTTCNGGSPLLFKSALVMLCFVVKNQFQVVFSFPIMAAGKFDRALDEEFGGVQFTFEQ